MRSPKTLALICAFSTLCFMSWSYAKTTQNDPRLNYQSPSGNSNVKGTVLKDVRFEPKSALDGLTKDHFRFSSETWEATDGVPVFLRREYCGSPKNAEKALNETVKAAFVVFETTTLRNKNREPTGRRIVATFDKEPPQKRMILWTNGEMMFSVESSSFAHALLFEKMFPSL